MIINLIIYKYQLVCIIIAIIIFVFCLENLIGQIIILICTTLRNYNINICIMWLKSYIFLKHKYMYVFICMYVCICVYNIYIFV